MFFRTGLQNLGFAGQVFLCFRNSGRIGMDQGGPVGVPVGITHPLISLNSGQQVVSGQAHDTMIRGHGDVAIDNADIVPVRQGSGQDRSSRNKHGPCVHPSVQHVLGIQHHLRKGPHGLLQFPNPVQFRQFIGHLPAPLRIQRKEVSGGRIREPPGSAESPASPTTACGPCFFCR